MKKKKAYMSQSALRGPSTTTDDLFSLLMSCLKKQKDLLFKLTVQLQVGGGCCSKLDASKVNLIWAQLLQPWSRGWCAHLPAAESVFPPSTRWHLWSLQYMDFSSSACLIPLVFINTSFKLLVNKTEHRYECVIKR